MRNIYSRLFLGLALAASLFTACQPPQKGLDAEDERNPYFRKAAKFVADQKYYAAIEEYENALHANPAVQKANVEIGLIYSDKLNDPIGAAYHFQKYLDAVPDSPSRQQVQTYLETARINFALTLPNSSAQNAQEFARISKENIELKQSLAMAQSSLARKEEDIAKLKAGLTVSSSEAPAPAPLPAQPVAASSTTDSTVPVAQAVNTPTTTGGARTHTIVKGDNLWNISKKYYDDINGGIEKIKQANPEATSNTQNLKLGTTLIIP